jgi:1-aminocyclopropane-1-carboxylate deaminase/D-cysteine desulfhydrase-like pyridoxal-dependent ACC family enzyme|tara:strand:- start:945 stop:1856 length:912 start_codon:yes stop_codon:yes gene_type:complete
MTEFTPIEVVDGVYFKRDDFYKPYGDYHPNGGKVRQAVMMFIVYLDEIRTKYNNGVITAAGVHSPQGANIAIVARHYGVDCITCVGGTSPEKLDNHHIMRLTKYYGSEIKIVAGHGMANVIHSKMKKIAEDTGYMEIEQGELLEKNPSEMFYATADQVENIPDDIDTLVIPTGSAVQLMGVLLGIKKFNKKVKNIHSICVGPTREKNMKRYEQELIDSMDGDYAWDKPHSLELNEFKMYAHKAPYSRSHVYEVNGTYIDDIYEGKAYHWMLDNVDTKKEKTLFWCVGKRPRPEDVDYIIENKL